LTKHTQALINSSETAMLVKDNTFSGTNEFTAAPTINGVAISTGGEARASAPGSSLQYYANNNYHFSALGETLYGKQDNSNFGVSVASSSDGTIVAVGTTKAYVQVFKYENNAWTQMGLNIELDSDSTYFGRYVSLSADGTTLAIGEPRKSNGYGSKIGQVHVYEYSGGSWALKGAIIPAPNHASNATDEYFGESVALSADGTIMAGGMPLYSTNANGTVTDLGGGVQIYKYSYFEGSWSLLGDKIISTIGQEKFGSTVAISENGYIVAVCASQTKSLTNGIYAGSVNVYKYTDESDAWTQIGSRIYGTTSDFLGYKALAISNDGTIIAIGAAGSGAGTGRVEVYQYSSGDWALLGEKIQGINTDDAFGSSVALSANGTVLSVGANHHDGNGVGSGQVRLFTYSGGKWLQIGEGIDGEIDNEFFGKTIALSSDGTIVFIGGLYNQKNGIGFGAARSYKIAEYKTHPKNIPYKPSTGSSFYDESMDIVKVYDGGAWKSTLTKTTEIDLSTEDTVNSLFYHPLGATITNSIPLNSNFGQTIATSDNGLVMAVGSPGYSRVFDYNGGSWVQRGTDFTGDSLGTTIALSGDGTVMAVGDSTANTNDGYIQIYKYFSSTWSQMGSDISGTVSGAEKLGSSIALSYDGSVVMVGLANSDNSGGTLNTGIAQVYYYREYDTTWIKKGSDIEGVATGDNFGQNVSVSNDGTIVAVSAPNNDTTNGTNSGYVQIYKYGNGWIQMGSNINGDSINDLFGSSLSLSTGGNIIAIGSYINTSNTGHVKIYRYLNSEWTQLGSDIEGTSTGDELGYSVDLSGDGKIVAIGSKYDASVSNSAHIKVYTYYNNAWTQIGSTIYDEGVNSSLGLSVSVSYDGTIVSLGNPFASTGAGNVKVYKMKKYNTYSVEIPSNPTVGVSYFDSATGTLYIYDGTTWKSLVMAEII
jgi:hypothetical protein